MRYKKEYADTAKAVLSKAYKTKVHVCTELGINSATYDEWFNKQASFKQAVEEGLVIGEANCRNVLTRLMLVPNNRVNTKLLSDLAKDVYGIGVESNGKDNDNDNPDEVKWTVEFVSTKDETTGKATAVSN